MDRLRRSLIADTVDGLEAADDFAYERVVALSSFEDEVVAKFAVAFR